MVDDPLTAFTQQQAADFGDDDRVEKRIR